jgi:2-polyprenyl-6-methoxyphenol hydroxylase-like FAD-dependent oxidoreductase
MSEYDYDVAIVGFGPVGQALAGLLGQAGHRVGVFERFHGVYPLPRAIRLDGHAMRLFQRLGIAEEVQRDAVPVDRYLWFGADDEVILDLRFDGVTHPSGWNSDYLFYQPHTEAALVAAVLQQPTVTVHRGWSASELSQTDDGIRLTVRAHPDGTPGEQAATRTVSARYVVGADGANSFVREACGIGWVDLGFAERWLVCDVRPDDMADFAHLPLAAQYCNPLRPSVAVRNGVSHRRWEFMLLDGDDAEALAENPALTWKLLEGHFSPNQGALVRHAVYEFRSLIAEAMRRDRALLAGDAAHLMPPFMGEGMCSGLRDANNLAWRLDLILRGVASDRLLDTYTPERRHQNEVSVQISIMMGQVSCTLDPAAAAGRDAAFRSGQAPPPPLVPGLGDGVNHHPADGAADPVAGHLAVQGRVRRDGEEGRFDDLVGHGFAVICREGDPGALLGADRLAFLEAIGATLVSLDGSAPGAVADADGALTRWLDDNGLAAVIARPDFYAFGGVADRSQLPALVDELRELVAATQNPQGEPMSTRESR